MATDKHAMGREKPRTIKRRKKSSMDATTLAAGLTSSIGDFTSSYGPIVLTVVGIVLGLWGLNFALSFIMGYVKPKPKAATSRA